jgi:putative endonuclease
MRRHEYFVYILCCSDQSYYVGITNNLARRLREHTLGISETAYTHDRRPVALVYSQGFKYVLDAIAWEKQLKGWSREKKEALIRGDISSLKWFAKREGVRRKAAVTLRGRATRHLSLTAMQTRERLKEVCHAEEPPKAATKRDTKTPDTSTPTLLPSSPTNAVSASCLPRPRILFRSGRCSRGTL